MSRVLHSIQTIGVTIVFTRLAALPLAARAASFNWLGGSGSNWTTAANWTLTSGGDGDGIPDDDDDVRFPTNASYATGISLNGDQSCATLTFATTNGTFSPITLGLPGQTLTITSGTVTRVELPALDSENRVRCNVVLSPTTGTNRWSIGGDVAVATASYELRFEGSVTSSVPIEKTARGQVAFQGVTAFPPPILKGGYIGLIGLPVVNVFGTNDIVLGYDGANGGSFYIKNLAQTITNRIVKSGGGAGVLAGFNATLTLLGDIDIATGNSLTFGTTSAGWFLLQNRITGGGDIITARSTTVFNSTNQFNRGNFYVGSIGGNALLEGLSWEQFTSVYTGGYGTVAGRWQHGSGGFAARGSSPLVITGSGAVGGGANAKTWFDRAIILGGYWDAATRDYANQPLVVQVNTELTARREWASAGGGPGLLGTHNNTRVNRFEGNITDPVAAGTGANRGNVRFYRGDPFVNDELILAGTNDWTGSSWDSGFYTGGDGARSLNTGRGGMNISVQSGQTILLQFEGPQCLPRGNGGLPAWLACGTRYGGQGAYLLRTATSGQTYALPTGYKFLLGSSDSVGNAACIGAVGATGPDGSSTLRDSAICLQSGTNLGPMTVDLMARGPCEFIMGAPGTGTNGAVLLQPTWSFEAANYDSGIAGAATVVSNSTAVRTLRTRGDGTVVLRHVEYTLLDGTGNTRGQFNWQLGTQQGTPFFEGALRETGTDLNNSVTGLALYIQGGVLELGGGDFVRSISNTPTAGMFQWTYGGGFAAHGAPRHIQILNQNPLDWNNLNGAPVSSHAINFGSRTANDTAIFDNDILLNGTATRNFATVRGVGTAPEGRVAGRITGNGGFVLRALTTRGGDTVPAGTLELAHTNSTYTGNTIVSNGTLLVNGTLRPSTAIVTVSGGALGGTGLIERVVNVASNAVLAPGNLDSVGTLTISSNLNLAAGAVLTWNYQNGAGDQVIVGRTLYVPTNAVVNAVSLGGDAPAGAVLFSAAAVTGATSVSGWTLNGLPGATLRLQGTQVLLTPPPKGTVMIAR